MFRAYADAFARESMALYRQNYDGYASSTTETPRQIKSKGTHSTSRSTVEAVGRWGH